METLTLFGVALVRVADADARSMPELGPWWFVSDRREVWVPLERSGEGSRAVHDGAPNYHAGAWILVPSWWILSRRRGHDAAVIRRVVDHVLAVARTSARVAV